MSFLGTLGKIGRSIGRVALRYGPFVAGTVNPLAGQIAQIIVEAIIEAQQRHAHEQGVGATKREEVVSQVTPKVQELIEKKLGKHAEEVAIDHDTAREAVGQIVDGYVRLLKGINSSDLERKLEEVE